MSESRHRRRADRGNGYQMQKEPAHCSISKKWATDGLGEDVVQIEVQLGDDADALSAGLRCWDDCLDAELHRLARPDDPRVDRADRLLAIAVGNRWDEPEFDQRGQSIRSHWHAGDSPPWCCGVG